MKNTLDMNGLPLEAKESIINFNEFIIQKYKGYDKRKPKTKQKLFAVMDKGIYTLPDDFVFDREELYD
ncbi:MAG: hypothetical protein KAW12_04405 [Candidatus Aminicenantes bacterium]|nr:hypothetical protein [Candidatus Aminicenantes bacterium]